MILMDLGASIFHGWQEKPDAVGAKWVVDRFARFGIRFDRIFMFEYTTYAPKKIFSDLSHEMLSTISYFNVGVEASKNSSFNPWNVLKSIAKADDFVVVKLDIDTPNIENALIDQVIQDDSISSIIDEMFYEHHVNIKAMHRFWHTERSRLTLNDSYSIFRQLREKGIRMHSWP